MIKKIWEKIKNFFKKEKKEREIIIDKKNLLKKEKHPMHLMIICDSSEKFYKKFGEFASSNSSKWNNFGGKIIFSKINENGFEIKRENIWLHCYIIKKGKEDIEFRCMFTDILYVDKKLNIKKETLMQLLTYTKCTKKINYF